MKPREPKPDTVFRIIDRATGEAKGSYSRAYCDEFDFSSVMDARTANFHGEFKDRAKYRIAKYRVTYELIEEDADPATPEEIEAARIAAEDRAKLEVEMDSLGLVGMARCKFAFERAMVNLAWEL